MTHVRVGVDRRPTLVALELVQMRVVGVPPDHNPPQPVRRRRGAVADVMRHPVTQGNGAGSATRHGIELRVARVNTAVVGSEQDRAAVRLPADDLAVGTEEGQLLRMAASRGHEPHLGRAAEGASVCNPVATRADAGGNTAPVHRDPHGRAVSAEQVPPPDVILAQEGDGGPTHGGRREIAPVAPLLGPQPRKAGQAAGAGENGQRLASQRRFPPGEDGGAVRRPA